METSSSKSARGRILVADDNKDARDLLSLVLGTMGFEVRVASDGKTALETAREFQPHLALLDVLMPDPNGFKASELLRKIEGLNDIIIVTATGWQKEEDDFLSKHAGADYHLLKPIDLERFQTILDKHLPADK